MSAEDSEEENVKRFEEIMEKANTKLQAESTRLMDAHHEAIQHSRKVILELRGLQARYEDIIDNIVIAHSIAAKEFADLYGDVIVAELGGVEEIDGQEFEEDDDES